MIPRVGRLIHGDGQEGAIGKSNDQIDHRTTRAQSLRENGPEWQLITSICHRFNSP